MKTLAIALESAGISVIVGGIIFEVQTQADIGFVFITCGAMMIATGSLIWAKIVRR